MMRYVSHYPLKQLLKILIILCIMLSVVSCPNDNGPDENDRSSTEPISLPLPKRVLFIGNSFTGYNGGIDTHLTGLAPFAETSRIVVGGATLQRHWHDTNTLKRIREGNWDSVVLQEQSVTPVLFQDQFYEFAKKLDAEIKNAGAETVFFMTWERPDAVAHGVTTQALASAYNKVGAELGAKVAPAGLAFSRSLQERPELRLNQQDGHPTIHGTYLSACVFYATIFNQNPIGNPYNIQGITEEEKAFLQQIAMQTVASAINAHN